VIVGANGKPVHTYQQLRAIVGRLRPGQRVRITYRRGDRTATSSIVTVSGPPPAPNQPNRALIGILTSTAFRFKLPFNAKFDLGSVGGPSAGLAFALELLEQRGRDVDHGYRVVATGELAPDGSVLAIGGVEQKTIGARRAHADVFLVPQDGGNARDARRYAAGLRIIAVKSFQQALRALAALPPKR
jgi:PDZ domain-containing protein